MAARLQEPHVIPVHDFGDIDGVLYIDMRLVEGASLKDELRANGPLDPGRAASIIAQVAAALDAAHARRPGAPRHQAGERAAHARRLRLSGRLRHRPRRRRREHDEDRVDHRIVRLHGRGTVQRRAVGPPSDVYSLTCLLYECLTGRPPFEAGDLRQLMSAHMFSPPPRPSIMRRGINRAFDDVIAKGMAKKPADRFASAGELAKAATAAALGARCRPHRRLCRARRLPPGSSRRCTRIRRARATRRTRRR